MTTTLSSETCTSEAERERQSQAKVAEAVWDGLTALNGLCALADCRFERSKSVLRKGC